MSTDYVKDRLGAVLASTTVNGIDFVSVSEDQLTLKVFFLNAVDLSGSVAKAKITGGETIGTVEVVPDGTGTWGIEGSRQTLTLAVPSPGDFSIYKLTLQHGLLDPYFSSVRFSFKANCPTDLDCKNVPPECPEPSGDLPIIDYLAKDFFSFRRALLDFSAQRYPGWVERSEADFGMMFLEALSSVADDLSYFQDRVSVEAAIETATERRSLVRLARLVDYEPKPALAAKVDLQLDVLPGIFSIANGLAFTSTNAEGTTLTFEVGYGLLDLSTGKISEQTFKVDPTWNRGQLRPYIWDASQACLKEGATEMWVEGHPAALKSAVDNPDVGSVPILIDTPAFSTADPPVREIVRVNKVEFAEDSVYGVSVAKLSWDAADALDHDHALFWSEDEFSVRGGTDPSRTVLAGNIVPATHGARATETFVIPDENGLMPAGAQAGARLAIARTGPNANLETPSVVYLSTLSNTPLAWLLRADAPDQTAPHPEIALDADRGTSDWLWISRLLDADLFAAAFTIDPAKYTSILGLSDGTSATDYDGDEGDTIRFGDGVFGEVPEPETVFTVTYRVGGEAAGNVARDSITGLSNDALTSVSTVTNPFPASGGADAESEDGIRRDAPQAFRAKQYRAVRREDYETAAATLPWVSRAGTQFRWTGSWVTVFTSADPKGTDTISLDREIDLIELLNRYRLAGYESYAPLPCYQSIDLQVRVCACPECFRGDVEAELLKTLGTGKTSSGLGYFHADRWTFGQPLELSSLIAAIESSYGVCGVLSVLYRLRGQTIDFVKLPQTVVVGPYEILQLNNDPSRPEEGTLKITVEGGK